MTQDIADMPLIAHIFQRQGWTWLDDHKPPDEARIREFIDQLVDHIGGAAIAVHSGRILVRNMAESGQEPDLEVFVNVSADAFLAASGVEPASEPAAYREASHE